MSLREASLIALRGLRAHRLRSALTMLGLIIGVAAVILLVACGQGVQKSVNTRIESVATSSRSCRSSPTSPGARPRRI
jgi:putative ABC transport system permease protein